MRYILQLLCIKIYLMHDDAEVNVVLASVAKDPSFKDILAKSIAYDLMSVNVNSFN